jgi:hypothetical protein
VIVSVVRPMMIPARIDSHINPGMDGSCPGGAKVDNDVLDVVGLPLKRGKQETCNEY